VEEHCRNREEVDGNQLFGVIVQECPPSLRWRFWMSNHIFAHRRFGDLDAELKQLAVNSRRSPTYVVSAQRPDQFARFLWNASATVSMPNLPGPVPTERPTVPVNNSSGFHNPEGLTPSGPESGQRDPETPIHRFQLGLRILSLKHNALVSKGKNLRL
jgi:hypothetical protein